MFWRSGWNVFDLLVYVEALAPGAGAWSVLRVLRVLTVVPETIHEEKEELESLLERMEGDLKLLRNTVDKLRGREG
jgi:hypothetical protein